MSPDLTGDEISFPNRFVLALITASYIVGQLFQFLLNRMTGLFVSVSSPVCETCQNMPVLFFQDSFLQVTVSNVHPFELGVKCHNGYNFESP